MTIGIKEDVFNALVAPKQQVVVAVTRKRREQLEYVVQTSLINAHVTRARNGTKFELPNGSVFYTQVQGNLDINVDTTKWSAKEWKAWITDEEKKEDAE